MPDVSEPTPATVPRNGIVVPGSQVRVRDTDGEHEYTMVTRATAGAPPECVSIGSPVGSALLGRRSGEQVRVQTPGGVRLLTVVDVATTAAASCAGTAPACEAGVRDAFAVVDIAAPEARFGKAASGRSVP